MTQLEKCFLNYLGEQEYTHWDNIVDFFNEVTVFELEQALYFLIEQGYAQKVTFPYNIYFQRSVKGGIEARGYTVTDDNDIPF